MTVTTRLCLFALLAVAAVVAWHWTADTARDETALAVRQFDNDAAVHAQLQQASLAANWWPFVMPLLIVLLGGVMFWDDAERWWKQTSEPEA